MVKGKRTSTKKKEQRISQRTGQPVIKYDRWITDGRPLTDQRRTKLEGAFKRHRRFLEGEVRRFSFITGVPEDFLYDYAFNALMRAALKYIPKPKATELTYIRSGIQNALRSGLYAWRRDHKATLEFKDIYAAKTPEPKSNQLVQERKMLRQIVLTLPEREAFVFIHRFGI